MTSLFDPYDKSSWYFGQMSRQDATNLLMGEKEGGVFLVRDSNSIHGDYVLCVREDSKVSHYIINKIQQSDHTEYRIGDQTFPDLPNLLAFYKLHYLDTTPLIRPAPRKIEKVIARYDFDGSDQDDLPFRKGDILTIISKDEEQWWTAKNVLGQVGSIPVPYVQKYDGAAHTQVCREHPATVSNSPGLATRHAPTNNIQQHHPGSTYSLRIAADANNITPQVGLGSVTGDPRKLPAYARVKQVRVPNAYDKTALKLEVGDVIKVTKMNINGQWEGELNGKVGHFPFTHVEFIDEPCEVTEDS